MAFLEQFSEQEKALLVALPYRAGILISHADTTGNPGAGEEETKALEAIVRRQASGMFYSAFIHEVMSELWARKADWPKWAANVESVLPECREASRLIGAKLGRRDLDAYRAAVMAIATDVAKAFRETDGGPLSTKLRLWKGRVGSVMRNEPYDPLAILNISKIEDKALEALARALAEGPDVLPG